MTPGVASTIFGRRLGLAEHYVAILADTGISHGLIGPREAPRLWERHVLGCAVIHPALSQGVTVADIGSGAGLPGVVLAIVRPDLEVVLVEPLGRRVGWLQDTIAELELLNVTVHEGRAESLFGLRRFPVVTARAVARIGLLSRWCLPLLEPDGRLVAMKGAKAASELEEDFTVVMAAGAVAAVISTYGEGLLDVPTTTVTVTVSKPPVAPHTAARSGGSGRPRPKTSRPRPPAST